MSSHDAAFGVGLTVHPFTKTREVEIFGAGGKPPCATK